MGKTEKKRNRVQKVKEKKKKRNRAAQKENEKCVSHNSDGNTVKIETAICAESINASYNMKILLLRDVKTSLIPMTSMIAC